MPIVQVQHVRILVNDLELFDRVGKLKLAGRRRQIVVPLGHFGSQLGPVMELDAFVKLDRYGQSIRILHDALRQVGLQLPSRRELHDALEAGEKPALIDRTHGRPITQDLRRRVMDQTQGPTGNRTAGLGSHGARSGRGPR